VTWQVLHRLAGAPLGKAARLVAGERNLGSQREHVRRKPLVQGGFEVKVIAAHIQDVVQGVESRLEDALQFGDLRAGHADSETMIGRRWYRRGRRPGRPSTAKIAKPRRQPFTPAPATPADCAAPPPTPATPALRPRRSPRTSSAAGTADWRTTS